MNATFDPVSPAASPARPGTGAHGLSDVRGDVLAVVQALLVAACFAMAGFIAAYAARLFL